MESSPPSDINQALGSDFGMITIAHLFGLGNLSRVSAALEVVQCTAHCTHPRRLRPFKGHPSVSIKQGYPSRIDLISRPYSGASPVKCPQPRRNPRHSINGAGFKAPSSVEFVRKVHKAASAKGLKVFDPIQQASLA